MTTENTVLYEDLTVEIESEGISEEIVDLVEESDDMSEESDDMSGNSEDISEDETANEDTHMCSICKKDTECDFITRCGHNFHESCINGCCFSCPKCGECVTCSKFVEKILFNTKKLDKNTQNEIYSILKEFFGVDITSYEISHLLKIGHFNSLVLGKLAVKARSLKGLHSILLRWICRRDDLYRLNVLIDHGLKLETNLKFAKSALKLAEKKGSYLVKNRIEDYLFNCTTWKNGNTPLHIALIKKDVCAAKQLIWKGAYINARNKKGERPLHLAAAKSCRGIVGLLICEGAIIDCQDFYGRTPLDRALSRNTGTGVSVALSLIDAGAKTDRIDNDMNTMLHRILKSENFEAARYILRLFPNMHQLNSYGESYINLTAGLGPNSLLRNLIEKGADVNIKDSNGNSPLHKAVMTNELKVVEFLLKNGANVNEPNGKNEYPIHLALKRSPSDHFVDVLIQYGADITIKKPDGKKISTSTVASHK